MTSLYYGLRVLRNYWKCNIINIMWPSLLVILELNEFVIQLDEEVEGMQSTILTLQQQLKGVKNELVEEKQIGEKQVDQIRVLEENLDQARTQPPSPVEGGKQSSEPMQCDELDTSDAENTAEDIERVPKGAESPPKLAESPGKGSESMAVKDGEIEHMEIRTAGENHARPDVNAELQEPSIKKPPAGTPPCRTTFSISQILGQSKTISSPVEETPMQSSPGGDAVVTKIAYMQGGYKDTSGEELRTDGETVVNGIVVCPEEGRQSPIVT